MASPDWQRVQTPSGASLAVPPGLIAANVHGVDSPVQIWSGEGVEVLVDASPMSDRLERHEGSEEVISGHRARVVDFPDACTHVYAAHFEEPALTVVVRTLRPEAASVAKTILASLAFSDQGG